MSIEQYRNRIVNVENSAADNIVEDVVIIDAKDAIETAIDDKDLPTPKSPSKKLITNRQLNFTLSPVATYNHKEMPYKLHNYEIDGTWNHHQSIILDVILDRIFYIAYQQFKSPPRSWRSKKAIEVVGKFSGGAVNPAFISYMNSSPIDAYEQMVGYSVREKLKEQYDYKKDQIGHVSFDQFVEDNLLQNQDYQELIRTMRERVKLFYSDYLVSLNPIKLFENYPLLKPYWHTLSGQLKKIEQTRYKMIYKVKYMQREPIYDEKSKMVDKGELIDLNYRMNEFQQLFEVVTAQKDEIVLNFKSPLGKLAIHNMLILDTDWWPIEAMSLSKNAYFIYKRFIFNKVFGKYKAKTLELKFDDLTEFLDLKWPNRGGVHSIIEKALNSMLQNKLIAGYTLNKHFVKKRSYNIYFENKVKGLEEKKEEDAKILKFTEYK